MPCKGRSPAKEFQCCSLARERRLPRARLPSPSSQQTPQLSPDRCALQTLSYWACGQPRLARAARRCAAWESHAPNLKWCRRASPSWLLGQCPEWQTTAAPPSPRVSQGRVRGGRRSRWPGSSSGGSRTRSAACCRTPSGGYSSPASRAAARGAPARVGRRGGPVSTATLKPCLPPQHGCRMGTIRATHPLAVIHTTAQRQQHGAAGAT